MTTIAVLPEVKKLIEQELSFGGYSSESDVVLKAMQVLAERRSVIEGIQRGLDDFAAGRSLSLNEFKSRIETKYPFLVDDVDDE